MATLTRPPLCGANAVSSECWAPVAPPVHTTALLWEEMGYVTPVPCFPADLPMLCFLTDPDPFQLWGGFCNVGGSPQWSCLYNTHTHTHSPAHPFHVTLTNLYPWCKPTRCYSGATPDRTWPSLISALQLKWSDALYRQLFTKKMREKHSSKGQ